MRLCYGLLIVNPFFIFSKAHRLKGLIKIINAFGWFSLFWDRRISFINEFINLLKSELKI